MADIVVLRPAVPEDMGITPSRQQYSFDVVGFEPGGFVHIDACVPMALAVEFMNLLTAYKPDSG